MKDGSDRFSLLIVDDELQIRKLLGSLFSETDYNLLFASNGPEALLMASKARIDAALVDLVMPEMNGHGGAQGDTHYTIRKRWWS